MGILMKQSDLSLVQTALENAFDAQGLTRLLRLKLDKDIDTITRGGTLTQIVFDTITAADRENWLDKLITHAKEENPNNYFMSMLGGEMQYGNQDDVSEIKIILLGSPRGGMPGFIEITNNKIFELDDRIRKVEIIVSDDRTSKMFLESWLAKFLVMGIVLGSMASLITGVMSLWR